MENVNPEEILRKLEAYIDDPPTCYLTLLAIGPFGRRNYTINKNNGFLFIDQEQYFDGDINHFIQKLSTGRHVISEISLIYILPELQSRFEFKMYADRVSYYGCDEKKVRIKLELFKRYAYLIECVNTLIRFSKKGLQLLKQKAENTSMEHYNKESAYQKEKEQQLFNDRVLRTLSRQNVSFGAERYDIDYSDTYSFTCDGEHEFNIRLTRIIELTLPQRINMLNGEIIEIYSKIPNNKEVVPQFVSMIQLILDKKMYTLFVERVITPLEHLLETSATKYKKKQRELIGDTHTLRGGIISLSFGRNDPLKTVNSEIAFLLKIK